jgi:hypothetical protein
MFSQNISSQLLKKWNVWYTFDFLAHPWPVKRRASPDEQSNLRDIDVLSHSPATLGTIFTSRAIIIHFLHLLH